MGWVNPSWAPRLSWKDTFEKRQQSRLPQLDTLLCRCPFCHQSDICRCVHCFHFDSPDNLLVRCSKQKRDKKNKKGTKVTSSRMEVTQNINNIEKFCCCLNCKGTEKQVVNLFRCQNAVPDFIVPADAELWTAITIKHFLRTL